MNPLACASSPSFQGVDVSDFNFLLTTLGLTKGNLSSHMDKLEKAGYVEVSKSS